MDTLVYARNWLDLNRPVFVDKLTALVATIKTQLGWVAPLLTEFYHRLFTPGISADLFLTGFKLAAGSWAVRMSCRFIFVAVKLLRRRATMVVSLGTGNPISRTKKDSWRVTVAAQEVGLAPLRWLEFLSYLTETIGVAMCGAGLLSSVALTPGSSVPLWTVQQALVSVFTLRPLRIFFDYPFETFVFYPTVFALWRWLAITRVAKAKVTVTQVVNNYYGGQNEVKTTKLDFSLVAALMSEASGLAWISRVFLAWRDAGLHHGYLFASRAYWTHFIQWTATYTADALARVAVYVMLGPMALLAITFAGTTRYGKVLVSPPQAALNVPLREEPRASQMEFVPGSTTVTTDTQVVSGEARAAEPPRLGLGFQPPERPRNALVEVFRFPHDVPMEVFSQGQAMLIGGDDLPQITTVTDPRYAVKIPMKPVVNNTFALDMLSVMGDTPLRREIERLTKVPPNPYRNATEMQKFVSAKLDVDFDSVSRYATMTFREFVLTALPMVFGLQSGERAVIDEFSDTPDMDYYLSAESRKHHPGWTTRVNGGQTKQDAWSYSFPRSRQLIAMLRGGQANALDAHVWLFLGVVKKQATRKKDDAEYRSRGAVIPEQELQLIWTHYLKPLAVLLESKPISWTSHFELFHGGLEKVWRKFESTGDFEFVNEDMRDHGASLEWEVAELIVQFFVRHTKHADGSGTERVYHALFREMIRANVGLPQADGSVAIYKTGRGMKDGVWGTDKIGLVYKAIGKLWLLWRQFNKSPELRSAFVDIFDLVRCPVAEIHGDNSLERFPRRLTPYLSGTDPINARIMKEIGMDVKHDESLVTNHLPSAYVMSWHMANVGRGSVRRIVGWKPTAEVLKGFFLPEKMLNYDSMAPSTRQYLGQIIVSLYILGFWNAEARMFLQHAWTLLWVGQDETEIGLNLVSDFVHKTGLDPATIRVKSTAVYPYPPEAVAQLWLGPGGEAYIDVFAPGAPTAADGSRLTRELAALSESTGFRVDLETSDWPVVAYNAEGSYFSVASLVYTPHSYVGAFMLICVATPICEELLKRIRIFGFRPFLFAIQWIEAGAQLAHGAYGGAVVKIVVHKAWADLPLWQGIAMHAVNNAFVFMVSGSPVPPLPYETLVRSIPGELVAATGVAFAGWGNLARTCVEAALGEIGWQELEPARVSTRAVAFHGEFVGVPVTARLYRWLEENL